MNAALARVHPSGLPHSSSAGAHALASISVVDHIAPPNPRPSGRHPGAKDAETRAFPRPDLSALVECSCSLGPQRRGASRTRPPRTLRSPMQYPMAVVPTSWPLPSWPAPPAASPRSPGYPRRQRTGPDPDSAASGPSHPSSSCARPCPSPSSWPRSEGPQPP